MIVFIARVILWFIFAFILFDTFNEFNRLFALSLTPYWAIVPDALVYGFKEFMNKKWAANEKKWAANESAAPTVKPTNSIISKIFYVIVCIIVVFIFLGILIVWAGVIYKAIIKA
jgi:hypothetical protein